MKTALLFRTLLLTLVLLTIGVFAFAEEKDDVTRTSADYQQALDNLLRQEAAGIVNADMYNQIGLSYYHQGFPGKATLYFLRALRLNSSHSEAKNNLEYIISRSPDKDIYAQPSFLSSLFQKAINFFTLNSLAVIALIFLVITTLCLHWLMHVTAGQDKAVPIMWLMIFGFVLLLSVVLLAFKSRDFHSDRTAVITAVEAEGFSGPGEEFGKLFTAHEGLIVHISRTDGNWVLISLPNGGAGWVSLSALERVKNR